MASLRGIHTREERAELLHIDVVRLVTGDHIVVFLALYFRCRSILRVTFFLYRHTHIALDTQFNRRIIRLAVEQRTITVLLTVEVVLQTEDVIRTILIHRRIGVRTNDQRSVGTVTDQYNSYHHSSRVEPTPEILAFVLRILRISFLMRIENCPGEQPDDQHNTDPHTGIERTAESVNEQQLEPSDECRNTRNNTV